VAGPALGWGCYWAMPGAQDELPSESGAGFPDLGLKPSRRKLLKGPISPPMASHLFEMAMAWCWPKARLAKNWRRIEGLEHLEQARQRQGEGARC